jgi:iron complex transport system substrate-binding protein
MITLAGARDVFSKPRTPSFRVTLDEVVAAQCGTSSSSRLAATTPPKPARIPLDGFSRWLERIPPYEPAAFIFLDANSYFSRPGPRLVTGLEILAKLFHPEASVAPEADSIVAPMFAVARSATS